MFEVKLQQFSGPLDKLLELIEEQKLPIASVSLASVTGDFLDYVNKTSQTMEPGILSDFLVVAAKLVLIKSRALLPNLELTPEEEGDIKDLEKRLEIYREFAARQEISAQRLNASAYLKKLWDQGGISLSRPLFFSLGERQIFYPSPNLSVQTLTTAFKNLTAALQEFLPETGKIKIVIISLEEKIKELFHRCQEAVRQSFQKLTGQRAKSEVVVMFLAILHLLRDQAIDAEQENQFGDILLKTK